MGLFNGKDKGVNLKVQMGHKQGLPGLNSGAILQLVLDEQNENIDIYVGFPKSEKRFSLPFSKITSVGSISEEAIKEANGVGRAIAGAVIFGPVGAIVGATTAKDKKKTVYYSAINYISNDEEKCIVLSSRGDIHEMKFFGKLRNLFNSKVEGHTGVTEL